MDIEKLKLRRFFVGGLSGGILATVILYVGTELLGFPFPPLAIFQLLIAPVPGSIQSFMVDTFLVCQVFGLRRLLRHLRHNVRSHRRRLNVCVQRRLTCQSQGSNACRRRRASFDWTWPSAGVSERVPSHIVIVRLDSCRHSRCGSEPNLRQNSHQLYENCAGRSNDEATPLAAVSLVRRDVLKKAVVAAAVLVLAGVAAKIGLSILSQQPVVTSGTAVPVNPSGSTTPTVTSGTPDIFSDSRISNLVASEVTDNRVFYRVDINPISLQLDFDTWRLNVHGKVNNAQTLDKNSLLQLATADEYGTLECVSNSINPPAGLISNAKWTGVPLPTLPNRRVYLPIRSMLFFGALTVTRSAYQSYCALEPGALLAYKMNDVMLPNEHGFPLRCDRLQEFMG